MGVVYLQLFVTVFLLGHPAEGGVAEESGLAVVLLQHGHPGGSHLVRLDWRPGVYVQIRAREGADLEELRMLVGRLRSIEESDAAALAQEITEGPRR